MKKIGLLLSLLFLFYSNSYCQKPCTALPTVVYEGKTYNTVRIGDQCWLKENLDVGKLVLGSVNQTNNDTIEKYCYNNIPANCTTYGGLYQWGEAVAYTNGASNETSPSPAFSGNIRGICPPGWHIPTSAEFTILATTVGGNAYSLKEIGQDGASTNTSGFSALLSGYRDIYYYNPNFFELDTSSNFWTSSETYSLTANYMFMYGDDNSIYQDPNLVKRLGFSVRCLYDEYPCPVELGLLTAVSNERTIRLNWETKTEKNSNKFDVERKAIGNDWGLVVSVKAAVLSNSPKQYSYTDKNLQSGKYQYRLKMIDNDGTFQYSSIVEAEVAVPQNYELNQNFPNPFNPNTVISYSLPLASYVKLIVYNTLGQAVKVLENGYQNAGSYSVNFNATELPSGTYYFKIEAGQFSQIKKMMLLK